MKLAGIVVTIACIGAGCSAGDASDVVMVDSDEYVLTCSSVREEARSDSRKAEYRPADGGATVEVAVHSVEGLPAENIVAVTGPEDVLCSDSGDPGDGVAFSSRTDIDTVNREIAPFVDGS